MQSFEVNILVGGERIINKVKIPFSKVDKPDSYFEELTDLLYSFATVLERIQSKARLEEEYVIIRAKDEYGNPSIDIHLSNEEYLPWLVHSTTALLNQLEYILHHEIEWRIFYSTSANDNRNSSGYIFSEASKVRCIGSSQSVTIHHPKTNTKLVTVNFIYQLPEHS